MLGTWQRAGDAVTLAVRPEPDHDYEATARLADEGFEKSGPSFDAARLRWLYTAAFAGGSTTLGLFDGERKVGQVVLLQHPVRAGGETCDAISLVDLFILKAFRSRDAIERLYAAVERFCLEHRVRFVLAVPNGKAAGVNARFLKLQSFLTLEIRAGLALPVMRGAGVVSVEAGRIGRAGCEDLFRRFLPATGDGLSWSADTLWARLQDPAARYGVHATDDLLVISSRRVTRRLPHTLLCAMMPRPGGRVTRADVGRLTAAACALQGRPPFVYVGLNTAVPLPGWSLPARLRPSPMVVQCRDLAATAVPPPFERFELLDFDFV